VCGNLQDLEYFGYWRFMEEPGLFSRLTSEICPRFFQLTNKNERIEAAVESLVADQEGSTIH